MARVKVSDGKSVKVTANKAYTDGDFAVVNGFHGFVIGDTVNGAPLVINIEQSEFEFTLASVAVGDIVYATSAGALTKTATGNKPVLKATVASDAANTVWGILLPQTTAVGA